MNLFNTLLYQPLLSLLKFIYCNLAFYNLGLAIIILTVLIRVILLPFFYKGAKNQIILQKLMPYIKQIQKKYKDQRQKQAELLIKLYRRYKINPFSGFFLLIIQLPILIALYRVFLNLNEISELENFIFLGMNLIKPSFPLAIVAGFLQYFQTYLTLPKSFESTKKNQEVSSKAVAYIFPVITVAILVKLPSAIGIYWIVTILFSILQQTYLNHKLKGMKVVVNDEISLD